LLHVVYDIFYVMFFYFLDDVDAISNINGPCFQISANRVHNDPSKSPQVVDFGTNRKRVGDFLLVLNNNE